MKFTYAMIKKLLSEVAPFAGAWIEIKSVIGNVVSTLVAPFAGAWIEISDEKELLFRAFVAPFAGAWIEIFITIICMLN